MCHPIVFHISMKCRLGIETAVPHACLQARVDVTEEIEVKTGRELRFFIANHPSGLKQVMRGSSGAIDDASRRMAHGGHPGTDASRRMKGFAVERATVHDPNGG